MRPVNLTCEYRAHPLGIDVAKARLSWQFDTERRGARQNAFHIQVAGELGSNPDLWDSERVESSQSVHVVYGGADLDSRKRVWWRVRVWDETERESAWSEWACWEMGLKKSDWKAKWIGSFLSGGPRTSAPVPYLRKEITLKASPLQARLYITALGLYEVRLNGRKVGEDLLAPGWTDYRKRVQYQTYDVSHMLTKGGNAIGAILGDGWYCGNVEWRGRQFYGDRPLLLAQIEVEYDDGSKEVFVTDSSWMHSFGPILESDLLMGEHYDARKEFTGWDGPGFDATGWLPVSEEQIEANLVAQQGPTVKATQEIVPVEDPKRIDRWPAPDYLFDMGQNMVGHVRLRVKGEAGKTIRLKFGEVLTDKGVLYTENLRSALQTDYYTLKGDPDGEVWEPRFTFHGFRYVEVRGLPEEPTRSTLTGIVVHSDTPKTGEFECSDELVNQLQKNIDWGQRGNFVDVPTDCPQRDERLGWTGDAQVFVRTAAFNRDVAGFFTKWQNDVLDSQGPEGQIPPTCPTTGVVDVDGGPAWADAAIICPWTIYLCYGDRRILEQHYDSMKRFMSFLESTHQDFIRCHPEYGGFRGFGDWLSIKADTPQDLIGTAFFAYGARLMAQIAGVLKKREDCRRYEELFEKIKAGFQRRFVTAEGLVTPQTQTAYILSLHFDLLPVEARAFAARQLVDDIRKRGWHLSAGFVGSPYINFVLTERGHNDVAFKLLFQKTWPSWLYSVTKGATTIWERWDGWTEENGFQDPSMNSFNHYAYGAVGAWLYQTVAGVDIDPDKPGYEHILLKPHVGDGLEFSKASYRSIRGLVESHWRLEGDAFHWDVTVPPNCHATAFLPATEGAPVYESDGPAASSAGVKAMGYADGFARFELGSGRYSFRTAKVVEQ